MRFTVSTLSVTLRIFKHWYLKETLDISTILLETKAADPDPQAKPFSDVNMSDLINLASMESLETGEGLIKMEDVRSSFETLNCDCSVLEMAQPNR